MDNVGAIHVISRETPSEGATASARTVWREREITARLHPEDGVLVAVMNHPDRPAFTPSLLRAGLAFCTRLAREVEAGRWPVRHLVWASARPDVWSLGGDLPFFLECVARGDREALRTYAHTCVELVHRTWRALDLPIRTVALVRGKAFGGGFEAALACDVLIAEEDARFGLPEALFGLFPGMGAWSLLDRRVDRRTLVRLVEEGEVVDARALAELGLVHRIAPAGRAEEALFSLVRERAPLFGRDLALDRVRRRVEGLGLAELSDIVEIWVERAMALEEGMLRRMRHFARAQERCGRARTSDTSGTPRPA